MIYCVDRQTGKDTIRIFILIDTASVNNLNVNGWQRSLLTTEHYCCLLEVSLLSELESSSNEIFIGSQVCATARTALPDPHL